MKEVEIKGQLYRTGKLSAMRQMLILKRLTIILGVIQPLMGKFDENKPENSLAGIGEAISSLPDESVEFIVFSCLDACSRKEEGGSWAPVARNGQIMFDSLDLLAILALTGHTLADNLKSFFQGLPSIVQVGGLLKGK